MKIGDTVSSLVIREPLKLGTLGTIERIDRNMPFPLYVNFTNVGDFPMKRNEVEVVDK